MRLDRMWEFSKLISLKNVEHFFGGLQLNELIFMEENFVPKPSKALKLFGINLEQINFWFQINFFLTKEFFKQIPVPVNFYGRINARNFQVLFFSFETILFKIVQISLL